MTLYRKKSGEGYVFYWDGPGCECGCFPGVGVLWQWWSGERHSQLYQCGVCSRDQHKRPLTLHPPNRLTVLKGRAKGARQVIPRRPEYGYGNNLSVWQAAAPEAKVGDGRGAVQVEDKTVNSVKLLERDKDGNV